MRPRTVRVVEAGWPQSVYVALDRAPEDLAVERELLASDVPSIEDGMKLAESALRERGARLGQWTAIGPCVRQALVFGGASC